MDSAFSTMASDARPQNAGSSCVLQTGAVHVGFNAVRISGGRDALFELGPEQPGRRASAHLVRITEPCPNLARSRCRVPATGNTHRSSYGGGHLNCSIRGKKPSMPPAASASPNSRLPALRAHVYELWSRVLPDKRQLAADDVTSRVHMRCRQLTVTTDSPLTI